MKMSELKPQILVAILCATLFSCMGIYLGYKLAAIEVMTAIIGGIFGFLAGVSMKILEGGD